MSALQAHARSLLVQEREIERATGSRFNLFQILGVGHHEVSTHSAILTELLNPCGKHGQGAVFLRRFLDIPGLRQASGFPRDFDISSATVRPEVGIGARTETSGGRLDILITDRNGRKIAIENKIHAAEQENWVTRYLGYLGGDGCLIYLTLHGDSPVEGTREEQDRILCISYASAIRDWLAACRKEATAVPVLRESLTQYQHLILNLTHQNQNQRMNDELVSTVLQSPENFDAYQVLVSAETAIQGGIILELAKRLKGKLPEGIGLISLPEGSGAAHDGFCFSMPPLGKAGLRAVISFDSPLYRNCYVGFERLDGSTGNPTDDEQRLSGCFTTIFASYGLACKSSGRWPAWAYWTRRQNWDRETLRAIQFDSTNFDTEFLQIVNDLHAAVEEFARTNEPV